MKVNIQKIEGSWKLGFVLDSGWPETPILRFSGAHA
jgi:hypothetical protein